MKLAADIIQSKSEESKKLVIQEYKNDQKRRRFNLNKEQTVSPIERLTDQHTLIDGLSKIQREDVEREMLYNQIIQKHN